MLGETESTTSAGCNFRPLMIILALLILAIASGSSAKAANNREAQIYNENQYANEVRPKGGKTIEKSQADTKLTPEQTEKLKRVAGIAFIVLTSCTVILLIIGSGSRIVVFADGNDALMSASMILAPIVTVVVSGLSLFVIPMVETQGDDSLWTGVKNNPVLAFMLGLGTIWWAWAVIGTLVSSIHHNGIIIGLLISALKAGAIFSIMLVWLGAINNYDDRHNPNHSIAKIIVFGLLIWLASKMVNGQRVLDRRLSLSDGNDTLSHA